MNIGDVARSTGLPAKTIRYYEEVGLIKPMRANNGYRDYRDRDVHVLRFLQRSRSLGFSIAEARKLLSLYGDENRHREDVRRLVTSRIAEIDHNGQDLRQGFQQGVINDVRQVAHRIKGVLGQRTDDFKQNIEKSRARVR